MSQIVKRILVVDDDPNVARALADCVGSMSALYAVETAVDGTHALEVVRSRRPDLVLLDINLPGRDGLTTLKDIRKLDRTIPVIIVTGRAESLVMTEALNNGAFAFVPKPFDLKYVENLAALALQPQMVAAR
ncbi:MAG: response regulator [Candidatus Rokuibacteriota bacterium]